MNVEMPAAPPYLPAAGAIPPPPPPSPAPPPPRAPQAPQGPPPPEEPTQHPGLGPTPDPTRSGALWVGGAGVALLLAAAAVLTAVRWDDIGQSAKLAGLVAITMALLGAGRRFKESIPMTAQAIFHLGAFLIPFDMAAVAILAGRSWQETLLLTSFTSVVGWYGIERVVPSPVLRWSAHVAVIALSAGIAAVSAIFMPLALAVAGAIALVVRQPKPAMLWAAVAGSLPMVGFVTWPVRIAGAMDDLGFNGFDLWQALVAGLIATATLVGVTRLVPRVEIALGAIATAVVTVLVALGGASEVNITFLTIAGLFVGVEVLALASVKDDLWKPIVETLTLLAEAIAALTTVTALMSIVDPTVSSALSPVSLVLLALGWLVADIRRAETSDHWLAPLLYGADWVPTTVMFPLAVLVAVHSFAGLGLALAIAEVALAYWMVSSWRTGAPYGALALGFIALNAADATNLWIELALGGALAVVLMLAARHALAKKDDLGAVLAATGGVFSWLIASQSALASFDSEWPTVPVLIGLWAMSWFLEARGADRTWHPADWAGRFAAALLVLPALFLSPVVGIVNCVVLVALSTIDWLRAKEDGARVGSALLNSYAIFGGVALGLVGVPILDLIGLDTAVGGAGLTLAGFVLVGLALVAPRHIELPLGVAAATATVIGLFMTYGNGGMLAVGMIAAGCTTMFIAFALRHLSVGIAGYVIVSLGAALGFAVLNVTWLEAYLALPALGALAFGYHHHPARVNSWVAYAPTIALMSYVAIADRIGGGSAWHAVIAGGIGVVSVIAGGYRRLAGPLVTGSVVLAVVVIYESLGPAALVPTWAWLALGGTILLAAGVAMERSDTSPLERGQQLCDVIATQFS